MHCCELVELEPIITTSEKTVTNVHIYLPSKKIKMCTSIYFSIAFHCIYILFYYVLSIFTMLSEPI